MKKIILFTFVALCIVSCTANKKTEMNSVSIQLIRNASLKVYYNGKTFLVDPVLAPKQSFTSFVVPNQNLNPTVDLNMSLQDITKDVDAILVTHTHEDHFFFTEEALDLLDHSLPLFAQAFDKEKIQNSPFHNLTFIDEQTDYENTTIIRTSGKHGPEELTQGLGEVSGFILKAKNYPVIYIVGDCLWDDEVKQSIQKYNPDIIITNSGGAVWGGEKILMDENSTVELAKFAPQAKVIAVHMEALDHCKTTRKSIQELASKEKISILIPEDGETIEL